MTEPPYWRTGRKLGRTIYAQLGDQPSDDDELIAIACAGTPSTSAMIARLIVDEHNDQIDAYEDQP